MGQNIVRTNSSLSSACTIRTDTVTGLSSGEDLPSDGEPGDKTYKPPKRTETEPSPPRRIIDDNGDEILEDSLVGYR